MDKFENFAMGLVGKEGIPLQPYHCDSLCPLHHQCSCGCGGGGGEEAPWGRHWDEDYESFEEADDEQQ